MRVAWLGFLAVTSCGTSTLSVVAEPGGAALPVVSPSPDWPRSGVRLSPPPVVVPASLQGRVIAIDAGHGAPGNTGAQSATCRAEADVVLPIAEAVAEYLENAGLSVVRLRPPGQSPSYSRRLARLSASEAELMISIHGDIRGQGVPWDAPDGCDGLWLAGQWGTAVLWTDEDPTRTEGRRRLAHALSQRLASTNFVPYDGENYESLYETSAPGAFISRHRPGSRIGFLRKPSVPSVIVEVGHLLDPSVEDRLGEPRVRAALAQAILGGVVDTLSPLPGEPSRQ
ncbi:MAG: N-acetylmuramoyl-L-alanine amidase [Myxococcota bacterium]